MQHARQQCRSTACLRDAEQDGQHAQKNGKPGGTEPKFLLSLHPGFGTCAHVSFLAALSALAQGLDGGRKMVKTRAK